MIEIIREEESGVMAEKRSLPKDIKQMGNPDIGDRIYVENEVYRFLHPYSNVEERRAYVLLGRFENYAGRACVFVEAAIFLEEMMFDGDVPLWNDGTWAYIYKQLRNEYDDMVIVGWAMEVKGQMPSITMRLEMLQQSHFGGTHQIFFLMDSLEHEESFYGNKDGHLYRREGFYVYYEKRKDAVSVQEPELKVESEPVQDVIQPMENAEPELLARGNYRRQMVEVEETRKLPAYTSTVVLALVVCVLGLSAYWNNEKMKSMEATLAQMNQTQNVVAETEMTEVKVENVSGNVTKQEGGSEMQTDSTSQAQVTEEDVDGVQAAGLDNAPEMAAMASAEQPTATTPAEQAATSTQVAAASVPTEQVLAEQTTAASTGQTETAATNATPTGQAATLTEVQTYLSQGYYIVQQGDSLVGICKKIYQTTAMMDKLCEVNGIENQDEIYAGQKLILPN